MSVPEMQARVKARVWQAVAQSGADLTGIPQSEMDKLVNTVTEHLLQEMDSVLGDISGTPGSVASAAPDDDDEAEQTLWEGRPFLAINVHYQITTERVRISRGVMGKDREDIELIRVQDIDQTQSVGERLLKLGDIQIRSHDPSSPEVVLNNVANPQEVHEILRRAVLKARRRHNLHYREEM